MVRGESEGGSGDKVKNKAKKAGKQNLERSEIPSDKAVGRKELKGKRAANTKVIPLIKYYNNNVVHYLTGCVH